MAKTFQPGDRVRITQTYHWAQGAEIASQYLQPLTENRVGMP
jgi:hypothetical protein